MRKVIHTLFLVLCSLLFSCATPYAPVGNMGGYSHMEVSPGSYRVRFQANTYTPESRAQDFALLRASELCLEGGYGYFIANTEASTGAVAETSIFNTGGGFRYNSLVVRCFEEKPDDQSGAIVYDANTVGENLRSTYKITK